MSSYPVSRLWITTALFLLVVMAGAGLEAQEGCTPIAREGWNVGTTNGWVGSYGSVVTVPMSGGNPGGYLRAEMVAVVGVHTESPPWVGSWADSEVGRISFDIIAPLTHVYGPVIWVQASPGTVPWRFSVATHLLAGDPWVHFDVPVNPNWSDDEARAGGWETWGNPDLSFVETMGNIEAFGVETAISGLTQRAIGVDNFTLWPCLFFDGFESGNTEGWSATLTSHSRGPKPARCAAFVP